MKASLIIASWVAVGVAIAFAGVYLFGIWFNLGLLSPVSDWLVARGLDSWLMPWSMVWSHFPAWVLAIGSGVLIRSIHERAFTVPALSLSWGYFGLSLWAALSYGVFLPGTFGYRAVIAAYCWDLIFIPMVFLGGALVPNCQHLLSDEPWIQFSSRRLLIAMTGMSVLLAALAYAGMIGTAALFLGLSTLLAYLATSRVNRIYGNGPPTRHAQETETLISANPR